MKSFANLVANLCAVGGILLYVCAALGFFMGASSLVYGFHAASVVTGGTALMSLAIFGKVQAR